MGSKLETSENLCAWAPGFRSLPDSRCYVPNNDSPRVLYTSGPYHIEATRSPTGHLTMLKIPTLKPTSLSSSFKHLVRYYSYHREVLVWKEMWFLCLSRK